MAWITPITDRMGPKPKTTATDMNRIGGNLNYLTGGSFKDDYTDADIVLTSDWLKLVEAVQDWNQDVTAETTWTNFNLIEATLEAAYKGGLYPLNNLYPSESLYPEGE